MLLHWHVPLVLGAKIKLYIPRTCVHMCKNAGKPDLKSIFMAKGDVCINHLNKCVFCTEHMVSHKSQHIQDDNAYRRGGGIHSGSFAMHFSFQTNPT